MWRAVGRQRGRQMRPLRLQGERVDKEGWGSLNTSPPVIRNRTGTPDRIRLYSLLIISVEQQHLTKQGSALPNRQEHSGSVTGGLLNSCRSQRAAMTPAKH